MAIITLSLFSSATDVFASPTIPLLQFEAGPISPGLPEFSWTGPGGSFTQGLGSVGNGDGNAPLASQMPGGLEVDVSNVVGPVSAPAGSGESVDTNGSHFFDVTMIVEGLTDVGTYVNMSSASAIPSLSAGTFIMTATNGVVLLQGNFVNSAITIPLSSTTTTAYESGEVNYTGGIILDAALANDLSETGAETINMTVLAPIGVNFDSSGLQQDMPASIDAFDADATGEFSTNALLPIPEPATLSLMTLIAVSTLARYDRTTKSAIVRNELARW